MADDLVNNKHLWVTTLGITEPIVLAFIIVTLCSGCCLLVVKLSAPCTEKPPSPGKVPETFYPGLWGFMTEVPHITAKEMV